MLFLRDLSLGFFYIVFALTKNTAKLFDINN